MSDEHEIAIIGGGVAGAAAALRAAQYSVPGVWITGDGQTAKRSRAQWVYNIDNMLGIHPDIVLGQLRKTWRKQPELLEALDQLDCLHIGTRALVENASARIAEYGPEIEERAGAATALRVVGEGDERRFEVDVAAAKKKGEPFTVRARSVVLATGVMDTQPLIAKKKGEDVITSTKWIYPFANRETVLYCIRCEGHLTRDTRAAVLGHSETAGQIGLMLAERYGSTVALLTNGEPAQLADGTRKLLAHHGAEIIETPIVDVVGEADAPKGTLRAFEFADGSQLEVNFAFVSLGIYQIYNDLAVQVGATLEGDDSTPPQQRHVIIDARGETSVPGLFAIGDMTRRDVPDEPVMKQVYTSQEYAVRAVDAIERRRRYRLREALLAELG